MTPSPISRRAFLGAALATAASVGLPAAETPSEPIIDIHQHTNYSGRTDEQLLAHQEALGVTTTVLLPAGRLYGLAAGCGGNDSVVQFARTHPSKYVFFTNEVADLSEARSEIQKYLRLGALGIGEQKFHVACDSDPIHRIAELAREFKVPVLLHFWDPEYNTGFDRFHRTLDKFPEVAFIGHAQTWWGHIDADYDRKAVYPTGKVKAGGLTDRLLTDHPNLYADLSAGSGLNALIRDEDHAREFIARHPKQLLYGSDCNDVFGRGPACSGAQMIAAVRRLAPSKQVERAILHDNAARLLRLPAGR